MNIYIPMLHLPIIIFFFYFLLLYLKQVLILKVREFNFEIFPTCQLFFFFFFNGILLLRSLPYIIYKLVVQSINAIYKIRHGYSILFFFLQFYKILKQLNIISKRARI